VDQKGISKQLSQEAPQRRISEIKFFGCGKDINAQTVQLNVESFARQLFPHSGFKHLLVEAQARYVSKPLMIVPAGHAYPLNLG
jgi:hypothetical protein